METFTLAKTIANNKQGKYENHENSMKTIT